MSRSANPALKVGDSARVDAPASRQTAIIRATVRRFMAFSSPLVLSLCLPSPGERESEWLPRDLDGPVDGPTTPIFRSRVEFARVGGKTPVAPSELLDEFAKVAGRTFDDRPSRRSIIDPTARVSRR